MIYLFTGTDAGKARAKAFAWVAAARAKAPEAAYQRLLPEQVTESALADAGERVGELHLGLAHCLDLAAEQHHPGLERVVDDVVAAGRAVASDQRGAGLGALGCLLLRHRMSPGA